MYIAKTIVQCERFRVCMPMYIAKTIVQCERFLHAFAVAHLVEMTGEGRNAGMIALQLLLDGLSRFFDAPHARRLRMTFRLSAQQAW